jgi:lipoprotein-anchoring transpeptidase ErfK/SrfK
MGDSMLRIVALVLALLAGAFLAPQSARADVVAIIDIHTQTVTVKVNGVTEHTFAASTARPGFFTPLGTFKAEKMFVMAYSSLYNNAPMPHAVFFHYGWAIHGTTETARLGRPASAGCVRLDPKNAKILFDLIKTHGQDSAHIIVVNSAVAAKTQTIQHVLGPLSYTVN